MYNLWQLMWAIALRIGADSHANATNLERVADPPGPDEAKRQRENSWVENNKNNLLD